MGKHDGFYKAAVIDLSDLRIMGRPAAKPNQHDKLDGRRNQRAKLNLPPIRA